MTIEKRRNLTGTLLLLIFVSMKLVTSLHTHGDVAAALPCSQCMEHVHHAHLSSPGTNGDCVLCNLLALPFLPTDEKVETDPATILLDKVHPTAVGLPVLPVETSSARAPPVCA